MVIEKSAGIVIAAMGLIVGVVGVLSAAAFLGYMEGRAFGEYMRDDGLSDLDFTPEGSREPKEDGADKPASAPDIHVGGTTPAEA